MRWLDHRLSTSKAEFPFQTISAQIARPRCECLPTQFVRCFPGSDTVANGQLRGISACNRYDTKRSATPDARNRYNLEGEEDRNPSVSRDAERRGFAEP